MTWARDSLKLVKQQALTNVSRSDDDVGFDLKCSQLDCSLTAHRLLIDCSLSAHRAYKSC